MFKHVLVACIATRYYFFLFFCKRQTTTTATINKKKEKTVHIYVVNVYNTSTQHNMYDFSYTDNVRNSYTNRILTYLQIHMLEQTLIYTNTKILRYTCLIHNESPVHRDSLYGLDNTEEEKKRKTKNPCG